MVEEGVAEEDQDKQCEGAEGDNAILALPPRRMLSGTAARAEEKKIGAPLNMAGGVTKITTGHPH